MMRSGDKFIQSAWGDRGDGPWSARRDLRSGLKGGNPVTT